MPTKHNQNFRVRHTTLGYSECIVEHGDLTAEATTQTITWAALDGDAIPAGCRISDVWVEPLNSFDDGGAGTLTIDVGEDGGDTDEYIDGADLTAAPGTIAVKNGTASLDVYKSAAYNPTLVFASDVNLNTFTAGKARVIIEWKQIHAEGT